MQRQQQYLRAILVHRTVHLVFRKRCVSTVEVFNGRNLLRSYNYLAVVPEVEQRRGRFLGKIKFISHLLK